MGIKFTDNALTTLASNISSSDGTLTVPAGRGDNFPVVAGGSGDFFVVTMENGSFQREQIQVFHRPSGSDTLGSVGFPNTRAYGTTPAARAWVAGDSVDLRLPSAVLNNVLNAQSNLESHIADTTDAHAASAITFTPSGLLTATKVQTAFDQVIPHTAVVVTSNALGNAVMTAADAFKTRVVTAAADLVLPDSAALQIGDIIEIKTVTEQRVALTRTGIVDTIDGDSSYLIPSYSSIRVMKYAASAYTILNKPQIDVGMVIPATNTSSSPGRGWLLCDITARDRVAYGGLFSVIGVNYGAGNGSSTFNTPDVRGRFVLGRDDMGGSNAGRVNTNSGINAVSLGAVGGHQLLMAHAHGASVSDPGHAHSISPAVGSEAGGLGGGGGVAVYSGGNSTSTNGTGVGVAVQTAGGGNAQNMPPCIVMNYYIKT
jgi:microcystin-dependent protein